MLIWIEQELPAAQARYRHCRGCAGMLATLHTLTKSLLMDDEVCIVFIDYCIALDTVSYIIYFYLINST